MRPIGLLLIGLLLSGLLLTMLAGVHATVGLRPPVIALEALLGLGALAWAWREAARSNQPMLLTGSREALHLAPRGAGAAQGLAAETIPWARVQTYTYWVRVFRSGVAAQYHLRLELAGGRVLHLADRPGTRPDDPAGTVRLDAVARRLPRWLRPGVRMRPLFYLTRTARLLLWVSGAAVASALLLLCLGHPAGLLLLYPAAGYGASYYLGRSTALLTAP